jgi:hypothetical protein
VIGGGVAARSPRAPVPSRAPRAADVFACLLLLVTALLPLAGELTRRAGEPVSINARRQIAGELLNRRAAAAGVLPLWNPYQFDGRPHLADLENRALYAPHLVLRFVPVRLLFPVSVALHVWLMALGAYLAARQLAASPLAAVLAAVAVLLATVLVPQSDVAYSGDVFRLAWVPLTMALAWRSSRRPTRMPDAPLAIVVAIALTASTRGAVYAMVAMVATYVFAALSPSSGPAQWRRLAAQGTLAACVALGLSAVQTWPAARWWWTGARLGGFTSGEPFGVPRDPSASKPLEPDAGLLSALAPRRGTRVLSSCNRVADESQLMAAGIAGAEGDSGLVLADYARFADIVRGPSSITAERPSYVPLAAADPEKIRTDLLPFFGANEAIACDDRGPRGWAREAVVANAAVYRNPQAAPRAFWTCAPQAVGRQELEDRLRRHRYDDRLVLRAKGPLINLRWAPAAGADRRRIEAELHVVFQREVGDRTGEYELLDASPANVAAIVRHPMVEDTAGLDRGALTTQQQPPSFTEPRSEWLIGASECAPPRAATVQVADLPDGRMAVQVEAPRDGVVFLSETYSPDRLAYVDGRRVDTLKVNLAFTAVPVSAGLHRVELRYDRAPFWQGVAVSVLTLAGWGVAIVRRRRGAAARA